MVQIQRISEEDGTVEHTHATRAELMREYEFLANDRSRAQGDKRVSNLAAIRTRLYELDREDATANAMKVAKTANWAAWAGAVAAWGVAALAFLEYLRHTGM